MLHNGNKLFSQHRTEKDGLIETKVKKVRRERQVPDFDYDQVNFSHLQLVFRLLSLLLHLFGLLCLLVFLYWFAFSYALPCFSSVCCS